MSNHYFGNFCPSCGYDLKEPMYKGDEHAPDDGIICSSCHFQAGVTDIDKGYTFKAWRHEWIKNGMIWDKGKNNPPQGWDPKEQLKNIGVIVDEKNNLLEDPQDPAWHRVPTDAERGLE